MKKLFKCGSFLLILLAGAGCQTPQSGSSILGGGDSDKPVKLIVGSVDSAAILHADPEYMPMAQEYLRDRTQLQLDFRKEAQHVDPKDVRAVQELQKTFTEKDQALSKRWRIKTNEFLKQRHGKMQDIVAEICKDKKIDMVIIDSKEYATIEYNAGVDITQDVLLKTSGGSAPVAGGTPAGDAK